MADASVLKTANEGVVRQPVVRPEHHTANRVYEQTATGHDHRFSLTRFSLSCAYDEFLLDLEAGRRSPGTLRYYRDKLGGFITWLRNEDVTDIREITSQLIRRYLVQRLATVQPLTAHHNAAVIKSFCNYLVRENLLPASPMRNVRMPVVETRILPALEAHQVKALLKACLTLRDKAIILSLLSTGLRASEFVALNVGDLDMATGAVHVRHTKTRNERIVYIGARTRKVLGQYLAQRDTSTPALWVSRGKRLSVNGLHLILKRLGDRAHVQPVQAHTFRRTFALTCLRSGMNIYVLQRLMGHKGLSQLQRYLSLVDIDLAQSVREHDPVDRLL